MFDTQDLELLQNDIPQDVLDGYSDFSDQEKYQDAAGPSLPPTGNYELRVAKWQLKKDKQGQPVYELGANGQKFPTITLLSAAIVGASQHPTADGEVNMGGGLGEGIERNIGLLFDIRTKPFERGGRAASSLVDILRAYDVTRAAIRSIPEGVETLRNLIDEKVTFRARLDWFAEDYQGRNERLKQFGETSAEQKARLTKEQLNSIYDQYRVKSMAKFERFANGRYNPLWISPANTPVEARLRIVRFYPSTETVRLGADAPRAVAA